MNPRRGFTLIELLAVIAVLGFVLQHLLSPLPLAVWPSSHCPPWETD